ncbi:unnamed protein product [Caretta caretta]
MIVKSKVNCKRVLFVSSWLFTLGDNQNVRILDFDCNRLGRPGVDCYCQHESGAAVLQLQFLINEGALVSASADDTLHLWNLRQKRPAILHSLKFNRERLGACQLGPSRTSSAPLTNASIHSPNFKKVDTNVKSPLRDLSSSVRILQQLRENITDVKIHAKEKELKQLLLFGGESYSSATLQLRITNYKVLLSEQDYLNWHRVPEFLDKVPIDSKEALRSLIMEGQLTAQTSWLSAFDASDIAE